MLHDLRPRPERSLAEQTIELVETRAHPRGVGSWMRGCALAVDLNQLQAEPGERGFDSP
jgi:hypothetical protein